MDKKSFTKVLASAAILTALAGVGISTSNGLSVSAARVSRISAKTKVHTIKHFASTKQLSGDGYAYKLTKGGDAYLYRGTSKQVAKFNLSKASQAQKLAAKMAGKMTFKIEKVVTVTSKGAANVGTYFYIVSQNKKYSGWANYPALMHRDTNAKWLAKVLRVEKRIAARMQAAPISHNHYRFTNAQLAANKKDFAAAEKLAKQLKGTKRQVALRSLSQLKQASNNASVDFPGILWTTLW